MNIISMAAKNKKGEKVITKTLLIIGLLLLVGIIFFTGCKRYFCHGRHCNSPEKHGKKIVKKISKELDLSEGQISKLETIKDEVMAKKADFRGLKEGVFDEILWQTKSETVDKDRIDALFNKKEEEFKEMRNFMTTKYIEFHDMLNQDQREKLAAKMEKMHDRYHKWHKR